MINHLGDPETATPLLRRYWESAMPMSLGQIIYCAAEGDVWDIGDRIRFATEVMAMAGYDADTVMAFERDFDELTVECYARRAGYELFDYDRFLDIHDTLQRDEELAKAERYLVVAAAFDPDYTVVLRDKYDPQPDDRIARAGDLLNQVARLRAELQAQFEPILQQILAGAERYAVNFDFPNPMIDLWMRTRLLENGLDHAQRYAERLGVDITGEIARIKKLAQDTLGYGPHELQ